MRTLAAAAISSILAIAAACTSEPPPRDPAIASSSAPSTTSWASAAIAAPPPPDPKNADADHDGIPDRNDKCPDAPETYNGYEDEDGCPDKAVCGYGPQKIVILETIAFEKGSSKIGPDATDLLHAVAEVVIAHPEFTLVEVEGYADDDVTVAKSLTLSTARANAVLAQLVAHGAPKDRLRAKGYGPYCRIDGAPAEKNRRVEFRIAKTLASAMVDPNELGCADASAHGQPPDPLP